ncbi:lysylphosphatidylglycerol synthase transmembrane domain-containing protein [Demequina capsici]|uniref:Lysylphosphatidylglycerol synthase transmembrane domain-containing protein n=1 Tax=Demequina capsici TaxID=3075620 RepID=A0AA96F6U9_9MICO|nr:MULTISPECIES: lysylphosphatidylglycerol synthase transmembrane domain-containing protein [unclassified Demequina]WNM24379.1 lysylphosphatidylglycerol synthase transmembrane domain-containing protein [Demequina sp. OYTSA14]WNM27201.1 lysylphosphatidylglycerol synthase transmembrane domain-containing protein [Demequina sp. PMTSA13]
MAADALVDQPGQPAGPAQVRIVDAPEVRVHRFTDLLSLIATLVGIVVVLLIGAYATGTTEGITEDVSGFAKVLQRLLVAPVNIFSGIVTLVIPAVVIIEMAVRREPRRILEMMGAAVLAFIATVVSALTTTYFGSTELIHGLAIRNSEGSMVVSLPAYISAVAAMLTVAGFRSGRRVLSVSWNLVWAAIAVAVISSIVTLPAALVTVLIGRATGLLLRWSIGSTADRAYGEALVAGIRRAGFDPKELVRADVHDEYAAVDLDEVSAAMGRTREGRVYALTTRENHHLLAIALDGDQHAAGFLVKFWNTLRLRGIDARADVSLRHTAEATALVSHAARTAGVRTARVLGMSHVRDTMIIIYQRPSGVVPLSGLDADAVSDATVDAIWEQVGQAHDAGISHRSLSADTILVGQDQGADPVVWLTSWELGEVATSTLAKRIDLAQTLALLVPVVGRERAVDSALRAMSDDDLEQVAPLLQSIVLPRSTRHALRKADHHALPNIRSAIITRLPDADIETENIQRFGWRTVLTLFLGVIAAAIILASFNTQTIIAALSEANLWWLLVALSFDWLTFIGAAISLAAFSPIRMPFNRVWLTQAAAAYIALAVPAGIGPAALNLRLLTRRKVPTPLAVATVGLVQVSSIIVTVTALVLLTLTTGSEGTLAALPSTSILIGVGVVAAVVALSLTVPRVRKLVAARVVPMARQTWPRLSQVIGQPWRLAVGIAGNLVLAGAYVGAFWAVLEAFGQDLALIDVAVLYFLSNAVGALVPTPGGLGAVETALIAGLTAAGLGAVAVPVAIIYRLISYWARIPMGYFAMKFLQNHGEL